MKLSALLRRPPALLEAKGIWYPDDTRKIRTTAGMDPVVTGKISDRDGKWRRTVAWHEIKSLHVTLALIAKVHRFKKGYVCLSRG